MSKVIINGSVHLIGFSSQYLEIFLPAIINDILNETDTAVKEVVASYNESVATQLIPNLVDAITDTYMESNLPKAISGSSVPITHVTQVDVLGGGDIQILCNA